jgi:archaellin
MYIAVIMVAATGSGFMIQVGQSYFEEANVIAEDTLLEFLVSIDVVTAIGRVDNSTGNVTAMELTVKCGIGCDSLDLNEITIQATTDDGVRHLSREGNDSFDYSALRDVSGSLAEGILKPGDLATISLETNLEPQESMILLFLLYPTGAHTVYIRMPDVFEGTVVTIG